MTVEELRKIKEEHKKLMDLLWQDTKVLYEQQTENAEVFLQKFADKYTPYFEVYGLTVGLIEDYVKHNQGTVLPHYVVWYELRGWDSYERLCLWDTTKGTLHDVCKAYLRVPDVSLRTCDYDVWVKVPAVISEVLEFSARVLAWKESRELAEAAERNRQALEAFGAVKASCRED